MLCDLSRSLFEYWTIRVGNIGICFGIIRMCTLRFRATRHNFDGFSLQCLYSKSHINGRYLGCSIEAFNMIIHRFMIHYSGAETRGKISFLDSTLLLICFGQIPVYDFLVQNGTPMIDMLIRSWKLKYLQKFKDSFSEPRISNLFAIMKIQKWSK